LASHGQQKILGAARRAKARIVRRLSTIRSFFKYAACLEPQLPHHCQQVLAMPSKRYDKRTIDYLTRAKIEALIRSADFTRWSGRRDRTLLLLAVQNGLRVSELINLTCGDALSATALTCDARARDARNDRRR
jgi:site-specific recombinase XerD